MGQEFPELRPSTGCFGHYGNVYLTLSSVSVVAVGGVVFVFASRPLGRTIMLVGILLALGAVLIQVWVSFAAGGGRS